MERKTIGGLIAALRKASGMTQKDLAEKLNVSDKSVSRWERDDGAPDLSLIPVIAEVFGVICDELLRGAAYGFSALNLCAGLLWLLNGQLVKKGVYAAKANFAHNHRWQKYCAVGLLSVLAMTFTCQWGLNQFAGVREFAEWDSFDNLNNFRTYIESDVEYHRNFYGAVNSAPMAQPDQTIFYFDAHGNVIPVEEALTEHLYEESEIVLTYVRRNEAVRDIRYSIKDGEILFLETLTWDNYYRANAQLNTFNTLFGLAYAAEYLIAIEFYWFKRKKA